MSHTLTLRSIEPVTHNTNHLVFERPEGFEFKPGQATDLVLDRDGWRNEERPFSFVSAPDAPTLDFVIKSYPDHDGVTEQIGQMKPGDKVIIGDAWGAIEDKGPGIFIAGGAGITPFIPILRARDREGALNACVLMFSNKSENDIILREEWEGMDGLSCTFTLTGQKHDTLPCEKIDKEFLAKRISNFKQMFYVCGPEEMVEEVIAALRDLGADEDRIVTEES